MCASLDKQLCEMPPVIQRAYAIPANQTGGAILIVKSIKAHFDLFCAALGLFKRWQVFQGKIAGIFCLQLLLSPL